MLEAARLEAEAGGRPELDLALAGRAGGRVGRRASDASGRLASTWAGAGGLDPLSCPVSVVLEKPQLTSCITGSHPSSQPWVLRPCAQPSDRGPYKQMSRLISQIPTAIARSTGVA